MLNSADVANAHRNAGLRLQHGTANVAGVFDQAYCADVDRLLSPLDETAARVYVVIGQRLLYLADAQPIRDQLRRLDIHLVFAGGSAENRYIDHVRHGLQLFRQHPILQGFQFHHVVRRVRAR